jgi:signal transduction histidine kinase
LTKGTLKKAGMACRQTLEATNPYVAGQADALTQVLLNLIFNAIDAMVPGGTISITTRNHQDTVLIDITDSGTGIAPDMMPYLFEPFFTTKKAGTGLGLFICHEIVTKHHGMIDIASPPGRGTVVTITFPSGEVIPGVCEEGT